MELQGSVPRRQLTLMEVMQNGYRRKEKGNEEYYNEILKEDTNGEKNFATRRQQSKNMMTKNPSWKSSKRDLVSYKISKDTNLKQELKIFFESS